MEARSPNTTPEWLACLSCGVPPCRRLAVLSQTCHPSIRQVHTQMKNNLSNPSAATNTGREGKHFAEQEEAMSLSSNKNI